MKDLLFICLFLVISFAQKADAKKKSEKDSLAKEIVVIPDNSEKIYLLEKAYLKETAYDLSLFEFHRPNYLAINGLMPKYQNYNRDFIKLGDHFSSLTDYKNINHAWLDTAEYSLLNQQYRTLLPDNQNPFTKMYLVDGDFLYANVDLTFYQRLNENFALYLGGNTRESVARGAGRLDHTQIRMKGDYFFSENQILSLSY